MTMASGVFNEPLVTFGVLSDVQYADCDDRPAIYEASKTRFYRGSLNQVDKAFKYWQECKQRVKFVLQLGDIIDGLNRSFGGSYVGLKNTLAHFEQHAMIPTFHTVGNHELYNFDREELASLFYESVKKINIPPEVFCPLKPVKKDSVTTSILYYKFCPVPNIKCISLDCFDVSVLGYDRSHPSYQEAADILSSKHGHHVFEDWDCDGPLTGLDVRFQQMNGALGKEQILWLEEELKESDHLEQKVIVFGHVSICPDNTDWSCLLWNYDEVLDVFHRHKCVVAYFSGHTHESGYALDSYGISYVAFTGIVETPPDTTAFATVSVYQDRLEISGHGLEHSYSVPFRNWFGVDCDKNLDVEIEPTNATVKVKV